MVKLQLIQSRSHPPGIQGSRGVNLKIMLKFTVKIQNNIGPRGGFRGGTPTAGEPMEKLSTFEGEERKEEK